MYQLFLIVLSLTVVAASPSGAPAAACNSMTPSHSSTPQTGPSTYSIDLSGTEYSQGQPITVTLRGSDPFKGFLIQARQVNDTSASPPRFGTFNVHADTKHACGDEDALTHSSPDDKNNVVINWTPPSSDVGPLEFRVTFVKEKATYWVAEASSTLTPGDFYTGESTSPSSPLPTSSATPTSTATPPPPGDVEVDLSACGRSKSCLRNPADCLGPDCQHIVTWRKIKAGGTRDGGVMNEDLVEFELSGSVDDNQAYLAFGLSDSQSMLNTSVVDCLYNKADASGVIQMSYNSATSKFNSLLNDPSLGLSSDGQTISLVDGRLTCTFRRLVTISSSSNADTPSVQDDDKVFDLDNKFYILIAKGPVSSSMSKSKHSESPLVSADQFDVTDPNMVNVGGQAGSPLVVVHGCLMICAWMIFASVGVLMPRHFKPAWPKQTLFGKQIWFQIHQPMMIAVFCFTITAFVVIFVDVGGYADYLTELPDKAHPIIGIVVTLLVIINPCMAAFRCGPTHPRRPLFNWAHFIVGQSAHLLAGAAMYLGVNLQRARMSDWSKWVVVTYICWHVLTEIILYLHSSFSSNKLFAGAGPKSYNMTTSASGDNLVDLETVSIKPGSKFKTAVISVHFIGVFACGITLMADLATQ